MPEVVIPLDDFGEGMAIVDLLVRANLASSKADARRGIQGRGFYLGHDAITDDTTRLTAAQLDEVDDAKVVILRKGKKNYVRVVVK